MTLPVDNSRRSNRNYKRKKKVANHVLHTEGEFFKFLGETQIVARNLHVAITNRTALGPTSIQGNKANDNVCDELGRLKAMVFILEHVMEEGYIQGAYEEQLQKLANEISNKAKPKEREK